MGKFCDDLIYQPNYRTQECKCTLTSDVKRGQLIYVTASSGAISDTKTSNAVYGVCLGDYSSSATSILVLVEGEVFKSKLDAVAGTALTAVETYELRQIGIIAK